MYQRSTNELLELRRNGLFMRLRRRESGIRLLDRLLSWSYRRRMHAVPGNPRPLRRRKHGSTSLQGLRVPDNLLGHAYQRLLPTRKHCCRVACNEQGSNYCCRICGRVYGYGSGEDEHSWGSICAWESDNGCCITYWWSAGFWNCGIGYVFVGNGIESLNVFEVDKVRLDDLTDSSGYDFVRFPILD